MQKWPVQKELHHASYGPPQRSGQYAKGAGVAQGPGLCHGVSGNGYALLSAYRHTQDAHYLMRAVRFATWLAEHWQELYGYADRPLSLFEVTCPTAAVPDESALFKYTHHSGILASFWGKVPGRQANES